MHVRHILSLYFTQVDILSLSTAIVFRSYANVGILARMLVYQHWLWLADGETLGRVEIWMKPILRER